MSDLAKVLCNTLTFKGSIELRAYESVDIFRLESMSLWAGSDRSGSRHIVFGDKVWRPIGEKRGIGFADLSPQYRFQLKVLTLGLYANGVAEGMDPLKWSTIVGGIRAIKPIALKLNQFGYSDLTCLNNMPSLKTRNVIFRVLNDLGLKDKHSASVSLSTSLRWLNCYSIFSDTVFEIFREYLQSFIASRKVAKHPVIPMGVMKKLIKMANKDLVDIETGLAFWLRFQEDQIKDIENGIYSFSSGRYYGHKSNHKNRRISEVTELISKLPIIVNIYALAFTGMRDGESFDLKNDCLINRVEDGKRIYLVKTCLSKTSDGPQELEWICNDITAHAIEMLVSVNLTIKKKAETILHRCSDRLNEKYINELKFGIKENRIFNTTISSYGCGFIKLNKRPNSGRFKIVDKFKVLVTEQDINQLNKLGCNYKSVSPNSVNRGVKYKVGDIFNFTPHQFRHTFAWFIIANKLGDLDDIRYQYKHLWENMTFVYSKKGYESVTELLTIG